MFQAPAVVQDFIEASELSMKRVPFRYLLEMYRERYASLKPSYLNHYKSPMKHLDRLLGGFYWDEIVPSRMTWYRATRGRERCPRTGQPIKGSTINREHSIVVHLHNCVINWMREGSIPKIKMPNVPPCFKVKKDDERKYQRRVHLSARDFDLFLSCATAKVKRVCLYMMITARRKKEVRLLSEENINRVMGVIQGNQPKTDKPYHNELSPTLLTLLSDTAIKMKFRADFVNFTKEFNESRARAVAHGCPYFQPRDLRRTAAIHAYRKCNDIRAVQELLGHSSTRTTEIYLNLPTEGAKKVAAELEAEYGEPLVPREWRRKIEVI